MLENAVKGAMAGLAGTTTLNAATYVDMVWRGRPASSTPEQVIEELAKRSGRTIPGDSHERPNRVQANRLWPAHPSGTLLSPSTASTRGSTPRPCL